MGIMPKYRYSTMQKAREALTRKFNPLTHRIYINRAGWFEIIKKEEESDGSD